MPQHSLRRPEPPPPPVLNGGLYTGEPFRKGAGYGNVPVVPDADYLIHHNLRSANPPGAALTQYPGGDRAGNNYQSMPGVRAVGGSWGVARCTNNIKMVHVGGWCECPGCVSARVVPR
jgi:hypothetical protein